MKGFKINSSIYQAGGSKYVRIPAALTKGLDLTMETPVTIEIIGNNKLKIVFE